MFFLNIILKEPLQPLACWLACGCSLGCCGELSTCVVSVLLTHWAANAGMQAGGTYKCKSQSMTMTWHEWQIDLWHFWQLRNHGCTIFVGLQKRTYSYPNTVENPFCTLILTQGCQVLKKWYIIYCKPQIMLLEFGYGYLLQVYIKQSWTI